LDAVGRAQLRLNFCALSGNPLAKSTANIVCDIHGNLFNLEAVLEYLVDAKKKQQLKSEFGIRKMKVRYCYLFLSTQFSVSMFDL